MSRNCFFGVLRENDQLGPFLILLSRNGISTGDFQEAFAALFGPNAAGRTSTTISRFKAD